MTFDPIHEIDCSTGVTTLRDPTPEEVEVYRADAEAQASRERDEAAAAEAAQARRDAVLATLAETTGFSPEEVAEALRA